MLPSGRSLFAAAIMMIFVFGCLMALQLSPVARLLPLLIGLPGAALGIVALRTDARVPRDVPERIEAASPQEWPAIVWMAAIWLAVLLFGFIVGAPLVTAAYLAFGLRYRLTAAVAGGLACLLMTQGLFEMAFGVPLFHGLLLS